MSLGWVECVGIADRSAYDLTVHAKATGTTLTAQEKLEVRTACFFLQKMMLCSVGFCSV